MGSGDDAGQMAGQVYQEGMLYYLFLKQVPTSAPSVQPIPTQK